MFTMFLNHPFTESDSGAVLVSVDDKRTFELSSSDTFIGRSKENDISLIGDLSLSRRHAAVTCVDGVYYLRDLRSSNGTLLNGKAVDGIVALKPDDEIFLGRSRFLFCPSVQRLESIRSYVSEAETTVLCNTSPAFNTRLQNMMLAFRRLRPAQPAPANPETTKLKPSMQAMRASHNSELLRGIHQ
ncbi:MAG: FHA domain-containing protein [Cyanobacteria bacterium SZAS LIN-5]|nr:FHA domain-containing protein [Cyanobacteria bacterium SZAS LIN-5]